MQTQTQIRTLLADRGLSPKKSLGQNFLVDGNLLNKLVDESGVGEGDLVLEVGPGTGTLTETLLERGCRVLACELDSGLSALLAETLGEKYPDRFTLIEADCLDSKRAMSARVVDALDGQPFKLVANLPYGAATPLILVLLTQHPNCLGLYFTVQREVADRLLAGPASAARAYGSVSVVVGALCEAKRLATLGPGCFWPQPEVNSAMVGLKRLDNPPAGTDPAWWPRMADLCQSLFAGRRKQLGKAVKLLAPNGIDWPTGIDPKARVETLEVVQIVSLARAVEKVREPPLPPTPSTR